MSASAIGSSNLGGLASFYQLHRKLLPPCLRTGLGLQHRTFCSITAPATTGDLTDLDVLRQVHHVFNAHFDKLTTFLQPLDMTSLEVFRRKLFLHLFPHFNSTHIPYCASMHTLMAQ